MAPLGDLPSCDKASSASSDVIMGKIDTQSTLFSSAELSDEELGDDDVFVLESIAEAKKNEEDRLRVTLVLGLRDAGQSLAKVLRAVEVNGGLIVHLETRETKEQQNISGKESTTVIASPRLDALLKLDIKLGSLMHFLKTLKRCSYLDAANLVSSRAVNVKCERSFNSNIFNGNFA